MALFSPFQQLALCTKCKRIVRPVPVLGICPHCGGWRLVKLTM